MITQSCTNRYNAVIQSLIRLDDKPKALDLALDICCELWDLLPRDLEEKAAEQIEKLADAMPEARKR